MLASAGGELSEVSYNEARLFADVTRTFLRGLARAGGAVRWLSINSARPLAPAVALYPLFFDYEIRR